MRDGFFEAMFSAQAALREAQEELLERSSNGAANAFELGRSIQALEETEDAVFNAVNVLKSYLEEPGAAKTMERWLNP